MKKVWGLIGILMFVVMAFFCSQAFAAVGVESNTSSLGVTEHLKFQGASATESAGTVTVNTLAETGDKTITGTLAVTSDTSLGGKITVTNAQVKGIATLASGNVTVNSTAVTGTTERIFLTYRSKSGTLGSLYPSAITNGTSFVITSSAGAADNSTVSWEIHN